MSELTKHKEREASPTKTEKQPKGWIRWSGLGIFLAVVGAVIAISYLSFTLLFKNQLESYATDIWGAKVEIGGVDLGVFPVRFGLLDVEITDPDKPMENVVQFGKVGASLNFYHLVVGRTVIEELAITALKFNQPREASGQTVFEESASSGEKNKKSKDDGFTIPKSAIPDFKTILAREKLETFIVAKRVEQQIIELGDDWNRVEKDLPTSEQLVGYKQEFQSIFSGEVKDLADIQRRKEALEDLQKKIEKNVKSLESARNLFAEKLPILKNDIVSLKKLPSQDLARLQKKYGLNQQGLSNVTYLLFGDEIQGYVNEGQFWYAKAKPFIDDYLAESAKKKRQAEADKQARAFGTNVAFREYDPQPEFIIKKLALSSLIPWGDLALNMTDINFVQSTSKKPINFVAKLQPAGQTGMLNIEGESNFTEIGKGFSVANIKMDDYQIKNWSLSDEKELPVMMKSATNQVRGKLTLLENEKISGQVKLAYQKVDFDLSRTESKSVKRYIAPIFEDINRFTVTTKVKGKLFAPDVGASSNLDRQLSNAFKKVLGKEVRIAKAKLTKQFKAKVAAEVAPIEAKLSKLVGEQVDLNKSYQALQDIMNKNPEDYVEQAKEQLKNKAKKKVQQKVDLEKEKQRQRANAKLEKEKEKLEKEKEKQVDRLKDKLKNLF